MDDGRKYKLLLYSFFLPFPSKRAQKEGKKGSPNAKIECAETVSERNCEKKIAMGRRTERQKETKKGGHFNRL